MEETVLEDQKLRKQLETETDELGLSILRLALLVQQQMLWVRHLVCAQKHSQTHGELRTIGISASVIHEPPQIPATRMATKLRTGLISPVRFLPDNRTRTTTVVPVVSSHQPPEDPTTTTREFVAIAPDQWRLSDEEWQKLLKILPASMSDTTTQSVRDTSEVPILADEREEVPDRRTKILNNFDYRKILQLIELLTGKDDEPANIQRVFQRIAATRVEHLLRPVESQGKFPKWLKPNDVPDMNADLLSPSEDGSVSLKALIFRLFKNLEQSLDLRSEEEKRRVEADSQADTQPASVLSNVEIEAALARRRRNQM